MGIQVVYNSEELKAAAGESFYEEDSFLFYNDVFMGQRSFFSPERVWFDNKELNFEAVQVLDKLKVPYERV